MLEKLPLRPEVFEEKLSLLIEALSLLVEGEGSQWARVTSSKPTQPKSRIRASIRKKPVSRDKGKKRDRRWNGGSIRIPSVFLSKQMTRRSQLKHSVASSIRAISLEAAQRQRKAKL